MLVVDFSYGFTAPESPLGSDMTPAVLATRRLLDAARRRDVPVWYTTVAYRSDLADAGIWPRKQPAQRHLIEGSRWVEIDSRLARRDHEVVVVKRFPSAFFGTPLRTMLVGAGVDTLVIAGCTTGCCVRSTVVDAMQSGYRVLVPRECVADRRRAAHEMHLEEIGRLFADVVPVDAVIRLLDRNPPAVASE